LLGAQVIGSGRYVTLVTVRHFAFHRSGLLG
jgi:hypothetical protein